MQPQDFFNFDRKLADRLAPHLAKTPLTPNQITTLSMLTGIAAAFAFSGGQRVWMLAGAGLLQLSFVLDNCDGAIARIKSLKSEFGKWYDTTADLVVEFALWAGLGFGALRQNVAPAIVHILVGAACLGSVINFIRVCSEEVKQKAEGPLVPRQKNPYLRAFDAVSHDGDPAVFIWVMALWANPYVFLWLGALYIHLLWAGSLVLNIV